MRDLFMQVFSMSLSGSLLILILILLRPLYRERFSKAWQYYVWLIVLLRLVIPYSPGFGLFNILFHQVPRTQGTAVTEAYVQSAPADQPFSIIDPDEFRETVSPAAPPPTASGHQIGPAPDFWQAAGILWLIGALLFFTYKGLRYVCFAREIRGNARRVTQERLTGLCEKTGVEMGIGKMLPIYESPYVTSPMLMGIWRPAVFLPETVTRMDPVSLSYVFRHELTHFKRRDLFFKWFAELVVCMHWFNPLVYAMSGGINRLCELSCDEAVAKDLDTNDKRKYGGTLLLAVSESVGDRRSALTTTLCEDKRRLKERLSAILNAARKPKKVIFASVLAAVVLFGSGFCLGAFSAERGQETPGISPGEADVTVNKPGTSGEADLCEQNEQAVRTLIADFGQTLKMVPITAPTEETAANIGKYYEEYVTQELLEKWQAAPELAPGRAVSSPWPDRISILSLEWNSDTECSVSGVVIEVTSVELTQGGAAATRPVTLRVQKSADRWLISGAVFGEYDQWGPVVYENDTYGFRFYLPETWRGYTIVEEQWQEAAVHEDGTGSAQTGPKLLIRNPNWTEEDPYQDIPIMVFTVQQWNAVQSGDLIVSAAPIVPSMLGSNSSYVFAIPPRYNFAFPTGYEEVQDILNGNPFRAEDAGE